MLAKEEELLKVKEKQVQAEERMREIESVQQQVAISSPPRLSWKHALALWREKRLTVCTLRLVAQPEQDAPGAAPGRD